MLSRLDRMVKEFVRRVSLARKLPEAVANEAGGKIFTFGSYRLGVHGTGALFLNRFPGVPLCGMYIGY